MKLESVAHIIELQKSFQMISKLDNPTRPDFLVTQNRIPIFKLCVGVWVGGLIVNETGFNTLVEMGVRMTKR